MPEYIQENEYEKQNPLQPIVSLLESISPLARLEVLLIIDAGEACVCHLEAPRYIHNERGFGYRFEAV